MTLSVPHFQQATPYTCLPACVRMILAFRGQYHSEAELAQAFNTIPLLGTLPEHVVSSLEGMGYHALWFENATVDRLRALLDHGWPIIALLRAVDLPQGTAGLHAVVVIGVASVEITFLDPTQSCPTTMEEFDFVQAWSKLDHQGIVVWVEDSHSSSP